MASMVDAFATRNAATTTEESETNQPMVYHYESPFFPSSSGDRSTPSALILLNTPIKSRGDTINDGKLSGVIGVLWETSSYRICADGGANRLYDATVAIHEDESGYFLPDLITGDLDSLRSDVKKYYETKGVSVVRVEDQNFHDLDKSLMAVEKWIEEEHDRNHNKDITEITNKSRAFIYGGFGGRFDQEMGCINALCVWGKKETFQQTTLALYDEETCAFALPELPMKSEIRIRFPGETAENADQNHQVGEGPTCGLIPIMGRCEKVITTGLEWNLEGDVPIEFGGLVSSSNRVIDEVVTVESSSPMLFTTEMMV
eukprot:CAMPEP_0172322624 /NCGR_PEP_ID=MMETSP1058-20130122/46431_1 /TAXON_ID=83371 /ORGANISM="Detonula confervacea, Strain CCMP 353" /LENGTH=315 /DNA_ID=CAMNT_0013038415 /DNA_START=146 /DNA_END=1093 /DNA_ORIENTATION=+